MDLIHLLWCCPKLNTYWTWVLGTLSKVFQSTIQDDLKQCIFGILDALEVHEISREAIYRVLFQACKLILQHWKSADPLTPTEWIRHMDDTPRLERYIHQHRCSPAKFEKIWANWFDIKAALKYTNKFQTIH